MIKIRPWMSKHWHRPSFLLPMIPVLSFYFLLRALTIAFMRYRYATIRNSFRSFTTWRLVKWILIRSMYHGLKYILKVEEVEERGAYYYTEEYEYRGKALIQRLVPIRRAIDVGANISSYTLFLARFCSRVVALEPDPRSRNV